MREPWTGVRIAIGRVHMRFHASPRPPSRSISLRIAHLHAAAPRLGRGAATEASAGGDAAQQRRSVGQQRKGEGEQAHTQTKKLEEGTMAEELFLAACEHEAIVAGARKKNR